MKQLETELAIIGGGCGGLAAAATAVEGGVRAIVFEKASHLAHGGNGPFAVESKYQRIKRMALTKEDALKMFMQYNHYRVDVRLVKAFVDKTGSTIDWLESMGVRFLEAVAYYPGAQAVWHYKDPETPRITEALADRAKRQGANIYLETPVKEILKENGRIVGLIAEEKSGESIQVRAKAVVVATGGFHQNPEWIKKYTGHELRRDLFLRGMDDPPLLQGDGIRMVWEVGGAETEMIIATTRSIPPPASTYGELGTFRMPLLMVNQLGERFVNEEIVFDHGLAGNAVNIQKNGCAFIIFDEATNKYYKENDWDWILAYIPGTRSSSNIADIIKKAQDDGYRYLYVADSLEELCTQTGINLDGLRGTLFEYNKACDTGYDEIFQKKAKYLKPVRQPKFYAARFLLGGYTSLGGVRINHKTEVLTKNHEVIPGLYTVGNDSNVVCGDTYIFALAGIMSGFAYSTGRIAGENATVYVKTAAK